MRGHAKHPRTRQRRREMPVTMGPRPGAHGQAAQTRPRVLLALTALAALAALVLGVTLASAAAPVLSVEDASSVRYTTAHVEGEVNPGDHEASYHFEYATQAQFEATEWAEASAAGFGSVGANEPPAEPSEEVGGLSPNTTYHLRLLAENSEGEHAEAVAADTFETEAVAKPIVTIDPVAGTPVSTVQLSGAVNPNSPEAEGSTDAAEQGAFRTEWHFECTPDCGNPSGTPVEADNSAHAVQAEATGLEPNKTYSVKLIASNAGGAEEVSESSGNPVQFTTATAPPTVTQPGNTPLGETESGVGAYVNPRNSAITDCHFEWGSTTAYGKSVPCLDEAGDPLGPVSDNSEHLVKAHLSGLTPGATYHYRLSVTSTVSTVTSDDAHLQALSAPETNCPNPNALGAARLPDCRAWEMVSPTDKNGGDVLGQNQHVRAAIDGSAAAFMSRAAFGDSIGGDIGFEYMALRGQDRWETHAITPAQEPLNAFGILGGFDPKWTGEFSPDLSKGIFRAWSPVPSAGEDPNVRAAMNLYSRDDLRTPGAGSYELLTKCPGCAGPLPPVTNNKFFPSLAGTSADFSKIIFESRNKLTADAPPPGTPKLYEWAEGSLNWVGQIPPGAESECGPAPLEACVDAPHSIAGQSSGSLAFAVSKTTPGTISTDGSRVFFTVGPSDEGSLEFEEGRGDLYMRDDRGTANTADDTSVKLNAVEGGSGEGETLAKYWTATPDGSRAYFTTAQQLTADDTDGSSDLYVYNAERPAGSRLTLLSVGLGGGEGAQGVVGISDDGSFVYLLFEGGIFLWHEGTVSFVGSVSSFDVTPDLLDGPWASFPGRTRSRVSPDGRFLVFISHDGGGLLSAHGGTDYDQTECRTDGCTEFYVYDAANDSLACASCRPDGAPATAKADSQVSLNSAVGTAQDSHLNRAMSADGRYVFFSTAERLVGADTNGQIDAYEYDLKTGEPHLLSSGQDSGPSFFMDASSNGHDVFILTRQALSGWDTDRAFDLYDARVDGGQPEPPPPPPTCQGDACQPAPTSLNDPTPSSSSFAGAGNQSPRHAKKHARHKSHRARHKGHRHKAHRHKQASQKHNQKRATSHKREAGR